MSNNRQQIEDRNHDQKQSERYSALLAYYKIEEPHDTEATKQVENKTTMTWKGEEERMAGYRKKVESLNKLLADIQDNLPNYEEIGLYKELQKDLNNVEDINNFDVYISAKKEKLALQELSSNPSILFTSSKVSNGPSFSKVDNADSPTLGKTQ
jgi:superfamily II RNA helicase